MSTRGFLNAFLTVFIILSLTSCQQKQTENEHPGIETDKETLIPTERLDEPTGWTSDSKDTETKTVLSNYQSPAENYALNDKRMMIRTGTMSLEVEYFNETEEKIKQTAVSLGGYTANSSSSLNAAGKKQGVITLRIPYDKYDLLLSEVSKLGRVMSQNITGKDVTEEYMDAQARLKTQTELEQRLLRLLAEKTARLTDIVEVEQKLAAVRENIERTEGRIRYLRDQASFSTLSVSLYEPSILQTSSGGGFFYEIGESVKKGLEGFTKVLSGLITVSIALIPLAAIVTVLFFIARMVLRKRKLAIAQKKSSS